MWVGMWLRWPLSGHRPRNWSAAARACSGVRDISITWMYMCSMPGWGGCPRSRRCRMPVSSTLRASTVSAPSAGSPVSRSQSSQGVRVMRASAKRATTSGSSGNRRYTPRMAAANASSHAENSSTAPAAPRGYRSGSASMRARSTGPAPWRRAMAAPVAAKQVARAAWRSVSLCHCQGRLMNGPAAKASPQQAMAQDGSARCASRKQCTASSRLKP